MERSLAPAERFRQAAWNLSPDETWSFLNRAKDDFLDHPTLPLLLAPARGDPYQRDYWASLALNLIAAYGKAGRLEDARASFELLRGLATAHPEELEVRLALAKGGFNLITVFGEAGRLEDARASFELLRELADAHPEDVGVRLRLAKAAFNLVIAFSEAGGLEDAHPKDAQIRLELAKGAANLINTSCDTRRLDDARALFDLLRQLGAAHPDEAEVRLHVAERAVNLIWNYSGAGRLDDARALFEWLRLLARAPRRGQGPTLPWVGSHKPDRPVRHRRSPRRRPDGYARR